MKKVFIVATKRTPLGSFGGALSSLSAIQLGTIATKAVIDESGIPVEKINEVFMGNVCQANLGQAPARQAALSAGIPYHVPCTTINKVCSSGMKSIMLGAQSIMLGINQVVLAGGMESMSNIPYYAPDVRWGAKYGSRELVDGLQKDGLTDSYDQIAMGVYADRTAKKYNISREEQDDFAIGSYKRAEKATTEGKFNTEIVEVEIPQRKGAPLIISEDEEYKKVRFDKIKILRPAFSKDGTVTAANASTINDGAAAFLLVSQEVLDQFQLNPIAEILSFADAAQEPEWFTTAPSLAAPKAIDRAGLSLSDIDLFEVNEAFSVVTLAFNKVLKLSNNLVNIHGGAVSLGHPLGASGARILTTLVNALRQENKELGCATLCNGGGGASAVVIRNMNYTI